MTETGVMKKFFVPYLGFTIVKCDGSEQNKAGQIKLKCRPSELPLYTEKICPPQSQTDNQNYTPSVFERKTGEIRRTIFNSLNGATNFYHSATDKINFSQAKEWTAYLREEDNVVPRTGAIALGGLTGLIFGLRGGFFRKTIYTTVGSLTMAAVCYPKEAAKYSQLAVEDSRRYLTIAYNFVYGVKPGDPQKELPSLPKLPTNFSEVWSLTSDLGNSAKEFVVNQLKSTSSSSNEQVKNDKK